MTHKLQWSLILICMSAAVGCTKEPAAKPQVEASPPPISISAPIKKAKQTAIDVQQKGREREQLDPQAQPEQSPDPAK
ncbi:MAG: hypothetical protein ACAF41_30485 [Leptolyngbya sp. BL-A-14]